MRISKIIAFAIGIPVCLAIIAVGAVYAFVDPNDYRPQIADALSKQLGRPVQLNGPIKLSLSWSHGIDLDVTDASVANPAWASRPLMAKIGHLDLGVGLQPLLQKKLEVSEFKLSDADIKLETNASGDTNYTFNGAAAHPAPGGGKPETASAKAGGPPVAIRVDQVAIDNSVLVMRGKDGKETKFDLKTLTLDAKGDGIKAHFEGNAAGAPVTLDLSGGALEKILGAKWPFTADAAYADYRLHASGALENAGKEVNLDAYNLTAGGDNLYGKMDVRLGGPRPVIDGTLSGDKIDLAHLMPPPSNNGSSADASAPAAPQDGNRLFSTAPLKLDALKAADAKLAISIGALVSGSMEMKQIHMALSLVDGKLTLSPLALVYADSPVQGSVTVDASGSPAQVRLALKAPQLDMAQLAKGMVKGTANADAAINTLGNSLHDFAANADGSVTIISGGGTVPTSTLTAIGGNLLNALAAGAGSTKLNCLAANFKIQQGQIHGDSLLLDTDQATMLLGGDVNLGAETMNMLLRTRPKVANIGSYTPSIRITGPLMGPRIAPDAASTVQKVAGLIMGNSSSGAADNGVPAVTAPAGQNACLYTLEHPQAASATPAKPSGNVIQDVTSGKTKLKDIGGTLLKGLFGK